MRKENSVRRARSGRLNSQAVARRDTGCLLSRSPGSRVARSRSCYVAPTSPSHAVLRRSGLSLTGLWMSGILDYRCGGSAGFQPASHYSTTGGNVGGEVGSCQGAMPDSFICWRRRRGSHVRGRAGFNEVLQSLHLLRENFIDVWRDALQTVRIVAADAVHEYDLRSGLVLRRLRDEREAQRSRDSCRLQRHRVRHST